MTTRREWPWDQFPDKHSTWERCLAAYDALVEAPNFDLIADKPLLVLQPKPAQPFVDPILHLLKVGKYYLRSFDGTEAGGIWIEHLGGEGMQCRHEDLEKLLDGFWDEKF